jgi:hypothetical protein
MADGCKQELGGFGWVFRGAIQRGGSGLPCRCSQRNGEQAKWQERVLGSLVSGVTSILR